MNIENIPSVQLSLPDLYSLLYGFDQFFGERAKSLSEHERPIFPILLVPYSLGVTLRDKDPAEKFFHIEFYPPNQAEIWHSLAWQESLTRRLRLTGHVKSYHRSPLEELRAELEEKLLAYFRTCRLRFVHARAMTEFLISGPESPDVLQLAGLPIDIAHLLQTYRESLNEPESTTDRAEGT